MKRFILSLLSLASTFWILQAGTSSLRAETARFSTTRDLWISSASGEEEGNNGATPRLKVKGYQEFSILDFDLSSLQGKKLNKATLHLKLASEERLYRVGVSSITSDWIEGSGTSYNKEQGASSFRWRKNSETPWFDPFVGSDDFEKRYEYSDITSVIFGEGGSIWANAEASELNDGWQSVDVSLDVVAAKVAGLSYGFVVFDDTGTELERSGNDVNIRLFPNRFFFGHDQNAASEPYLEVEYEGVSEKQVQPAPPADVTTSVERLPYGDVVLSWKHSSLLKDDVVGFLLKINGKDVPRSLIPSPLLGCSAFEPKEEQTFETRLRGLDPKKTNQLEIVAVNRVGNKSDVVKSTFKSSDIKFDDWQTIVAKSNKKKADVSKERTLPKLGKREVFVVDEFVKFMENDESIPATEDDYRFANTIWNAKRQEVFLTSAKNEFVGFQIALKGTEKQNVKFKLNWDSSKDSILPEQTFYRFIRVQTPKGKIVDPVVSLAPEKDQTTLSDEFETVYCEIFVPASIRSGESSGLLTISDDSGDSLRLNLRLKVWNFSLPNELNFLPEMNCYSLPANERDYYRLAQVHRTYINHVPYSHRGTVGDDLAPRWDPKTHTFDWGAWEKRYGGYFDGSAFADLPRGAVPIEAFYLPLFENYPANIFEGFSGENTWPTEEAFSDEYRSTFNDGVKGFAQKIHDKRWNDVRFLFFLNNKMDYKKNGWDRASSPWLLDEPASYRDFAALEFFGRQVKNTLKNEGLENTILYRADISRPQWERNSLDSCLDVYVVGGGAFRDYRRMALSRSERFHRLVYTYGTTAPPHDSSYQPVFWSLDAWSLGADGIVPWQTIGNDDSWQTGDELSLFYPKSAEIGAVTPSIRLKAYRRGEQDVEYLTLLLQLTQRTREEVGEALRERLSLGSVSNVSKSSEDAGTSIYSAVSPDELQRFRRELGECLDRLSKGSPSKK